jgi:hypothetical protein
MMINKDISVDPDSVQKIKPRYPSWPSSKPGPQSTLPPMGMRPVNVFRPEQVVEIAYNEQTGDSLEHSLSDATTHGSIRIDQPRNAQEALGKRKVRL